MEVKQKRVKNIRPKLKLFRASEPEKSVLMWSVHYSLSQLSHIPPKAVLLADDFKASMKVSVSNHLYIKDHMPVSYKFKEYCPMVFQDLRRRFQITDDMLLESFVNHQPLRRIQRSKSGKSSFMLTWDKRFTAICLTSDEADNVQGFLEEYHAHIVSWQGKTCLPKWLALYRIQIGDKNTHVLIVTNLFYPPGRLSWKFAFNLSMDAEVDKKSNTSQMKKSSFLHEENFQSYKHKISLSDSDKQELWDVLKRDVKFLNDHHYPYYRLLLGVVGPLSSEVVDSGSFNKTSTRVASSTEDERSSESEISDAEVSKSSPPQTDGDLAGDGCDKIMAVERKRQRTRDYNDFGIFQGTGDCSYYFGLHVSLKRSYGTGKSRRRSVIGSEFSDEDLSTSPPIASVSSMIQEDRTNVKRSKLHDFFVKYVA